MTSATSTTSSTPESLVLTWSRKNIFALLFFVFIFCSAASICFTDLGKSKLENWDEGFYAEVTKQMIQRNNYIIPFWNGEVFLDKPPLNFWLNAVAVKAIGTNEFSVRLVSAMAGTAVIMLAVYIAWRRWSYIPAVFVFLTLALNNIFIWRARTGNLDALATLLILLTFMCMVSHWRRRYIALGFLFGLLFLQKASLVGLPLGVFVLSELVFYHHDIRKNLKQYFYLVLAFAVSVLPWLAIATVKTSPSFALYFLTRSDQGVAQATLQNFQLNYFWHVYYALQRRFFFLLIVGTVATLVSIRQYFFFALFLFSFALVTLLSFTERNNNWYLTPAMPFLSLCIGYGVFSIIKLASRVRPWAGIVMGLLMLIPGLYIAYKTYTVNIAAVINTRASESEVATALFIKNHSSAHDKIMRLDFSYPVTIYYSDRQTFYYPQIDEAIDPTIKLKQTAWIVGKKDGVDQFKKITKYRILHEYKLNDESIVHIDINQAQ